MNKHLSRNLLASSILSAMLVSQAYAQSNSSPGASSATQASNEQAPATPQTSQTAASSKNAAQLQSVTVTAQHRQELAQKIPMSISTISGAQLDRLQVRNIEDVKFAVPNMVIEPLAATPSGLKVFMRGVGQEDSMFTADPAVALYINDVYIPRLNGAMLDLYDVERIEVLRGPQGTLYGRNATGGAIRYVTRKPDGKNTLAAKVTLGNYGRRDLILSFGTHIGKVDISGAVMSRNRDGYSLDLTTDRKVNTSHVNGARTTLTMPLGESTYATLNLDYLKDTSGAPFPTQVKFDTNGHVVPVFGSVYKIRSNIPGSYGLKQYGVSFATDSDFGAFSLRNIIHTRGMDNKFYVDVDGTEQTRFHLYQDQTQHQYGYEAQLTSQIDGPFSWVGGFFAFRETNSQPTRSDIFARGSTNNVSQQTNAYAIYWQGNYNVSDQLKFIAGGRYSFEKKDFRVVSTRVNGTQAFDITLNRQWTHPDWKLGAEYNFTDDFMSYVTVSTGFKSGGFNGRASTAATVTAVAPEHVRAYEAGMKSTWLDNRLRVNIDYYRNDYSALQFTATRPDGAFTLINASGALFQGVEADIQAQVTSKWNVSAGFGTIDARYKDFDAANNSIFLGKPVKDAPKFQSFLSTTYVQPLPNAELDLSAQIRYTDSYFEDLADSRMIMAQPNHEVGARIAYRPTNSRWSMALWGKNLTNNHTSSGGFYIPVLGISVIYPTMPRTYGIDFNYRFL
ncbi:MAG: TonB-dependent receptor [Rhodanobacter sp.]